MKKSVIIPMIIGGALLTYIVYSLFADKKLNWNEHLRTDSRDPYGTEIFFELLKTNKKANTYEELEKIEELNYYSTDTAKSEVYITWGHHLNYLDEEFRQLENFVYDGGHVVMLSEYFDQQSLKRLLNCDDFSIGRFVSEQVEIYSLSDSMVGQFPAREYDDTVERSWTYLNDTGDCGFQDYIDLEILANYSNGRTYGIRYEYGNGAFVIFMTPIILTNIHLLEEENLEFVESLLSKLPEGDYYYDPLAKYPKIPNSEKSFKSEGPLKYILSKRELRWAWLLLLITTLLFIIFKARRRERIMPLKEPKDNSSLEYAESLSLLHFHAKSHNSIAAYMRDQWTYFIRNRYQLNFKWNDQEFVNRLSDKSGLDKKFVANLVNRLARIRPNIEYDDDELLKLNYLLEKFYKNGEKL